MIDLKINNVLIKKEIENEIFTDKNFRIFSFSFYFTFFLSLILIIAYNYNLSPSVSFLLNIALGFLMSFNFINLMCTEDIIEGLKKNSIIFINIFAFSFFSSFLFSLSFCFCLYVICKIMGINPDISVIIYNLYLSLVVLNLVSIFLYNKKLKQKKYVDKINLVSEIKNKLKKSNEYFNKKINSIEDVEYYESLSRKLNFNDSEKNFIDKKLEILKSGNYKNIDEYIIKKRDNENKTEFFVENF